MNAARVRTPFAVVLVTLLVATLAGIAFDQPTSEAASRRDPIVFGAVGSSKEEIRDHERVLGRKMQGLRVYKKWGSTLFGRDQLWARDTGHTLFLSVTADRRGGGFRSWSRIARAERGSKVYGEIVDMARQVKRFRDTVYFIFNHEPEASANHAKGSPRDFRRAWRTIVKTFRAHDVRNAEYVLTMTAWGFRRDDRHAADRYWPGRRYVDHIAADAYNWYGCRGGPRQWTSMRKLVSGLKDFGTRFPEKGLMLMEWGSVEDPLHPRRKARWMGKARELFKKPSYAQFKALLQWGGRSGAGLASCPFDYVTSRAAKKAWRKFGNDPAYTGNRI